MHVLFIHQNFPAQFRYIAPRLITEHGWQCSFITERQEGELPGVRKILYKPRGGATMANSVFTRNFENAVAHAHGVFESLKEVKDLQPDLVVAHSGFGSSLYTPYLYDAPVINFLEYFYQPIGQDLGFRPEVPVGEMELLRSRTNNSMILLDVINCDRGWTPTTYQREMFPKELQVKIESIFDGIDTAVYHRKEGALERVRQLCQIDPSHRIVTYVARGFEMMRGFDIFMKAAKIICDRMQDVTLVVVGTDKVHYGGDLKYIKENTFRQHVLSEGGYDLSRFRFTGYVDQHVLADILSASDIHLYLTEPFIASWSMVDAMACGAVVLASDQRCVREYIVPGENGLLVNFFDHQAFAEQTIEVLNNREKYRPLAEAGIKTVFEKFSLDVAMPRIKDFFERVAATPRSPSTTLEKLVKVGTLERITTDPDALARKARMTDPKPSQPELTPDAPPPVDGTPLEQAVAQIKQLGSQPRSIPDWIRLTHSFKGPAPDYAALGVRHHPTDLARLLQRFSEWKANTVVELGVEDGGTLFLFTRIASEDAQLIAAPLIGREIAEAKVPFFESMARVRQKITCLGSADSPEKFEKQLDAALGGRKIDLLFLHGRRPYKGLSGDFRRMKKRVRDGGLIAWDGINGMPPFGPDRDGGHRLWAEVKPLYPQRAEYLNGTATEFGGIAAIKT
jgi:glycosyltransferase involved in cell wall biosynthesis